MEILNEQLVTSLRDALGSDVIQVLVSAYVQDAQERLQRADVCFKEGSIDDLGRLAHSLKGSSANLGLERAASCASELQTACEKNETARISALVPQLRQEVAVGIQKLQSF